MVRVKKALKVAMRSGGDRLQRVITCGMISSATTTRYVCSINTLTNNRRFLSAPSAFSPTSGFLVWAVR